MLLNYDTNKKYEESIAKYFDKESSTIDNRQEKKLFSKTALTHIESITSQKAQTSLDVGCGSGRILSQLLENGAQQAIGIDLSPKMIALATQNLEKKSLLQRTTLINGSFLEYPPEKIDAVSLHRVLCCHPDRKHMLEQTLAYQPRIIALTIPRQWIFIRIPLNIVIHVRKLLKKHGFLPYMHKQKSIDQQLIKAGYVVQKRVKTMIWVTTIYLKQSLK